MSQITAKEASQILGISKRTLYRWEEEGRIKSTREGILNVRVYDRDYLLMVRKLLDLSKKIDEHNTKLPEILEQSKEHHLEQTYFPGKPLKLSSEEEVEAAMKAFNNEDAWETEHDEQMTEYGLLLADFKRNFPEVTLEELLALLKENKSK